MMMKLTSSHRGPGVYAGPNRGPQPHLALDRGHHAVALWESTSENIKVVTHHLRENSVNEFINQR